MSASCFFSVAKDEGGDEWALCLSRICDGQCLCTCKPLGCSLELEVEQRESMMALLMDPYVASVSWLL